MAKQMRMTKGNIPKQLILYAIPLILGNLFQLTYNVVDSIIVGRFIGKDALAAVGTASPVMNIFILGISGICIGSSVIMGRFFGAGEEERLHREHATMLTAGSLFSLILTILGMLAAPFILKLLQVPTEIFHSSTIYLRLIFLGMPFTFFYNVLSYAMKSVGDSKTPLHFLIFASVLNGVLDLILIGIFHLGIVCSALTTVIAQAVSVIFCAYYIQRRIPLLAMHKKQWKIDPSLLKETLKLGGVTALQQSCQPIGKFMIQGIVNTLGINVMAAFNAVGRIDDYAFTPEQNISHAMTTFMAQNYGAKEKKRMKQGFYYGMLLEFCYGCFICIFVFLLKEPLVGMFLGKTADAIMVQEEGVKYLSLMSFFYILPALTNGMQGFFRGIGSMWITLLGTLTQISIRVLFTFLLAGELGISGIAYGCFFGWIFMLVVEGILYFYKIKRIDYK